MAGLVITAVPSSLTLRQGQSQTVTVTIVNNTGANGWEDLLVSCDDTTFVTGGSAHDIEVLSSRVLSSTPAVSASGYGLATFTGSYTYVYYDTWTGAPKNGITWTVELTIRPRGTAYGFRDLNLYAAMQKTSGGVSTTERSNAIKLTFDVINASGQGSPPVTPTWAANPVAASPSQINTTFSVPVPATTTVVASLTNPIGAIAAQTATSTSGASVSVSLTGLATATTYYIRATSANEFGTAPASVIKSIKTLGLPAAPAAPVITSIVSSIYGISQTITFTPSAVQNSGIQSYPNSYEFYNSTDNVTFSRWINISTPNISASSGNTVASGLQPNTLYYWKVKSTNAGGSTFSAVISKRTAETAGSIPTAPTGLAVTSPSGSPGKYTQLDLSWTDNSSVETGFWIEYYDNAVDPGVWITASSQAPPNVTTYTHTGLTAGHTYSYRVRARNGAGVSDPTATVSHATVAAPAIPGAPTGLVATPVDDSSITLTFFPTTPFNADKYVLFRSAVSGSGFSEITTITADPTDDATTLITITDRNLSASASYYYKVKSRNFGGDSAASSEATARTAARPVSVAVSPPTFTLDDDSKNSIVAVLGRTIIKSDLDRGIVRTAGGYWFKEGLKRQLAAPGLTTEPSGGTLAAGAYRVYTVLYRTHDETRSEFSAASSIVNLTLGERLRVAPQQADGKVVCRDIGYDPSGTLIDGCDYWEIYIADTNSVNAYLVEQLPLTSADWEDSLGSGAYTIDGALDYSNLFSSARRTMALSGENSLPPCTSRAAFKGTHVITFGERLVAPDASETSAFLAILHGESTFDVTGYTLPEAAIYHELWLNGIPTGWEVYDIESDTGYIRHGDPAINAAGFNQTGGSFSNFKFIPKNRVYYSAWFSGGITSNLVFSPETFPPLTTFANEFSPDDGRFPNAIISLGDEAFISKPGKWFGIRGGDEPDAPQPQITAISNTSGCIAPDTVCADRRGNLYYLGDTGVHRLSPAGVEQVVDYTGNAFLFRELVDISSVPDAVGCYFSREELAVFTNLNLIGNTSRTDGVIFDTRNNAILTFSTPLNQITSMAEVINISGEFQIATGSSGSYLGALFDKGVSVDGVNYSALSPFAATVPIVFWERSGPLDSEHATTVVSIQTRLRHLSPSNGYSCQLLFGGGNRNGSPDSFVATKTERFDSLDSRDRIHPGGNYNQQAMIEFRGETSTVDPRQRLSWSGFIVEAVLRA